MVILVDFLFFISHNFLITQFVYFYSENFSSSSTFITTGSLPVTNFFLPVLKFSLASRSMKWAQKHTKPNYSTKQAILLNMTHSHHAYNTVIKTKRHNFVTSLNLSGLVPERFDIKKLTSTFREHRPFNARKSFFALEGTTTTSVWEICFVKILIVYYLPKDYFLLIHLT